MSSFNYTQAPVAQSMESVLVGFESLNTILTRFQRDEEESFESSFGDIWVGAFIRENSAGLPAWVIEGDVSTEAENNTSAKEGFIKRAYEWIKEKIKQFFDWITGRKSREDKIKAIIKQGEERTKTVIANAHVEAQRAAAGYVYEISVPEYVAKEGSTVSIQTVASKLAGNTNEVFTRIEKLFSETADIIKKGTSAEEQSRQSTQLMNKKRGPSVRVSLDINGEDTVKKLYDQVEAVYKSLDARLDKMTDARNKIVADLEKQMDEVEKLPKDELVKQGPAVSYLINASKWISGIHLAAMALLATEMFPDFKVKVLSNH